MPPNTAADNSGALAKTVATELVVQYLCSVLSPAQKDSVLELLQQHRSHIASAALTPEELAAWAQVFEHINPYEQILAGLPPQPPAH
jgi:hypothetical protein